MAHDYAKRQARNDESRVTADAHREDWSADEVQLLQESWCEAPIEDIAATLGRTIEACRQKHYDLRVVSQRTRQAKSSNNSRWDRGWTSLEDMGY